MSNPKTLKNLKDRTPEERVEIARAGGLASVAKKRELKTMRETVKMLLDMHYDKDWDTSKSWQFNALDIPEELRTQRFCIAFEIISKAKCGDMRAAELVLKLSGELLPPPREEDAPAEDFPPAE